MDVPAVGDVSSNNRALASLALSLHAAPGRFALLLGSGVSYSAGIPTGWDVVADLIGRLAVAEGEHGRPDDPVAWHLERHGQAPDYSTLLEEIAPTAAQRRDLLASYFEPTDDEREVGIKTPTRAHRSIAKLVARGTVTVIVTTNFDRLLEQALIAEGVEPAVIATAAAAQGALPLAHSRCTIIKVHGDFLDPNFKNTAGELSAYEPSVDAILDRVFDEYGLVVCGWSATWDPALRNAIARCATRRFGMYWATRGELTAEANQLVTHRDAHTLLIDGADEFFDGLVGKIEALDDLAGRTIAGADLVVAEVKRYIPNPVHRIRLHDLVLDVAERSVSSIDFDGNPPDNKYDAYLRTARRLEAASVDVVAALATLGEFAGTDTQNALVTQVIRRLASPAHDRLGGSTAFINLRCYPALLGLYALGLGACRSANWAPLLRTFEERVPDHYRDVDVAVLQRLASYNVLDSDATNHSFGEGSRRRTPVSDFVHDTLSSMLRQQFRMPEAEFSQLFDEWEFMIGVLVDCQRPGSAPVGRFIWRNRYRYDDRLPDRAIRSSFPLLLAAGILGGDDTADTVIEKYLQHARRGGLHW